MDSGFTGVHSKAAKTDGIPQESTVDKKAELEFTGMVNLCSGQLTLHCSHNFMPIPTFALPSFFCGQLLLRFGSLQRILS